jgi:hypothetical protein
MGKSHCRGQNKSRLIMATKIGSIAASGVPHIDAIQQGLREQKLGEGLDVELIWRVANGDLLKLPAFVSGLAAWIREC